MKHIIHQNSSLTVPRSPRCLGAANRPMLASISLLLLGFAIGLLVHFGAAHRLSLAAQAEAGEKLEEVQRFWDGGELDEAHSLASQLEDGTFTAHAARVWMDRIETRKLELSEFRKASDRMIAEIAAISDDTPIEQAQELFAKVEADFSSLDEMHRDAVLERWQQKRETIQGYWQGRFGGLAVETVPAGAELFVGGTMVEATPARLGGLTKGEYQVKILHAGYEPWSGEVEVQGGAFVDLGTVRLERSVSVAVIESEPAGMTWRLIGTEFQTEGVERTGTTPARVENLPTGEYRVAFKLAGWPEEISPSRVVRVERGKEAEVRLETGILLLNVDGPKPGEWLLKVNNETIGPEIGHRFRFPANEPYAVTVEAPGWEAREGSVRLEPGLEQIVALTLPPAEWTVLLRSQYPAHWDTRIPETETAFAIPLSEAPEDMEYLRVRRMDTGEFVIIPLAHSELREVVNLSESIVWKGSARYERRFPHGEMRDNYLLGIANREWMAPYRQGTFILRAEGSSRSGYRGWGFSKAAFLNSHQRWSWAGEQIEPAVFEIAVKAGPLSSEERSRLLVER